MSAGVEYSLGPVEGQTWYACLNLKASREDSPVASETFCSRKVRSQGRKVSGIRSLCEPGNLDKALLLLESLQK